ncbi:MAG: bestrophin family ion channel [Mariniblastus sp.]|nr:bestrophin family ion channel [Mariniblastus sp.]
MIEYNNKVWFRHILNFHKTDTFRILLREMLIVAAYTAIVAAVEIHFLRDLRMSESGEAVEKVLKNTTIMHSILGFVLSLLVVFRTNTAYDRWWEGRKMWGALVNNTRNLSVKINAFLPESCQAEKEFFRAMIGNFPTALKEHLREGIKLNEIEEVEEFKPSIFRADQQHVPNLMIQSLYRKTKSLVDSGHLSGDELIVVDKELKSFFDIMGACERIKNTPIPFSYSIFLKKFIFFYIVTLPIGFVAYFEYWAIPISVFVFYVLVSLEIIAEEIEMPFGRDANDLPTQKLADMMRRNVNEIFAN